MTLSKYRELEGFMLALAKDITQEIPTHPQESEIPELKEYMDYQRKINTEKLVFHALDHAKTFLQKNIRDAGEDKAQLEDYRKKAFPISFGLIADADTLLLMLRKMINAHNSTNNWYRMNPFYYSVLYDCVERFVKIYNRLVRENPEKSQEYRVSDGLEVDFDDWAQLYFHDLDFLIGKTPEYLHYSFTQRNRAIHKAIYEATQDGTPREEAIQKIKAEFSLDPSTVNILLGKTVGPKELELFYTSAENPIYETLYSTDSEEGFMDGESLADHAYFMAYQIKNKSEEELAQWMEELSQASKH